MDSTQTISELFFNHDIINVLTFCGNLRFTKRETSCSVIHGNYRGQTA